MKLRYKLCHKRQVHNYSTLEHHQRMNQEERPTANDEIVRQLFEACREQPQSIDRIRSLFMRRSNDNDDDNATVDIEEAGEDQSLTTGSDNVSAEEEIPTRRESRRDRTTTSRRSSSSYSYQEARDENGLTLLSVACLYGASLEVIHFLATQQLLYQHHYHSRRRQVVVVDIDNRHIDDIDNDADNDVNGEGSTNDVLDNCLQYACFAGANLDVILYLMQFDPQAVKVPDCTGQLALHAACCCSRPSSPNDTPGAGGGVSLAVIYALLRQYPQAVTMVDHKGRTPLHHACSNPGISLPVVQCLVRNYAAAVHVKDENEMLPLHRACWYRAPLDVIDFLVDQYPPALQCRDQDGELPLHLTCLATTTMTTTAAVDDEDNTVTTCMLLTLIPLLLNRYPQAIWQRNISGYLPLELVSEKLPNVVQVLQLLTPSGWPPLHFACTQACSMRTMSRLLALFPNDETTSLSQSPLSLSVLSSSAPSQTVETCWDVVLDTNPPHPPTTLLPLLFYACQGPRANLNVARLLMEHNPRLILETSRQTGDTVLHHACRNGGTHVQIVEYLVQSHPAAVTTQNQQGFIPLDLALMVHKAMPVSVNGVTQTTSSSPPTLDVLYFLVRNYPHHILSYA